LDAYVILFAVVLAVNLMPAFGPPTWSIIVIFGFNTDLPVPGTVAVGALAAASGRFLLACAFRLLGERVPEKMRQNLTAAREAFERRKRAGVMALALFALSPVPSAQLFEAAGLAKIKLLAFTAAFFCGRLISYSIYATTARALRAETAGEAFAKQLLSPAGIILQLVMIGALVAFTMIDWARILGHREGLPERDEQPKGRS
jgi:uncharacterized membrane protein YdjX (TVP38/TMEM64 family)